MAKKETAKETTTLNVDRDKYKESRAASGAKSLNNGDIVAETLGGMELDEIIGVTTKFMADDTDWEAQYSHLNPGMQRMNMGNVMRRKIREIDEQCEQQEADGKKVGPGGEDSFIKASAAFRKTADKRAATDEKAKAKAKTDKSKKAA